MSHKKNFVSIRLKLIGVILLGLMTILAVEFFANYLFFKDAISENSFWYYLLKVGPSVTVVLVIIIALLLYYFDEELIRPINALTNVTSKFAYDTNDKREENVKQIFQLKYHKRRDELGRLYSAIAMTSRESMEFAEDVMKQAETITKMQSGLLMVIAEMVESRDQSTGSHIKKTKAYVELIVKEMQKKGIHQEFLTKKMGDYIINAAPLHDVGKIHIPDRILQSKEKLSEQDYEVMKTHTTHGAKMIQYAIDKMGGEDAGYLVEAKNVAHFHHEKWNGQGYPEGLQGEEIPLSARIMAVADVFDAISSRRSYKEPIPFEEAMQIMQSYSGTYFDPVILDVFLDAKDEVQKIAKEFEENEVI